MFKNDIIIFTFRALYSHFTGILGAASCDKPGKPFMAEIVGAAYEHEITLMNSLTVNLHLMMQVKKFMYSKCWNLTARGINVTKSIQLIFLVLGFLSPD